MRKSAVKVISLPLILFSFVEYREKKSGIEFPIYFNSRLNGRSYKLIGVDARQVTLIRFNAYALGVYLEESNFREQAILDSNYDENAATKIINNSDLIGLRLVPARNTNAIHLRNAYRKIFDEMNDERGRKDEERIEAIDAFLASFPQVLPIGTELMVECQPQTGKVQIWFKGLNIAKIQSVWLAKALPMIYLDPTRNLLPDLIKQISKQWEE